MGKTVLHAFLKKPAVAVGIKPQTTYAVWVAARKREGDAIVKCE